MIKKWLQANKVTFPIMVVSILVLGGVLLIAFSGYYANKADRNYGFNLIPEEIVQPVSVVEEIPIVENIVEVPVEDPVVEIVLYPDHGISCTLISPVDTVEVQRYAAAKGCDILLMPYIDEFRLCNIVTGTCVLILEDDIPKRY